MDVGMERDGEWEKGQSGSHSKTQSRNSPAAVTTTVGAVHIWVTVCCPNVDREICRSIGNLYFVLVPTGVQEQREAKIRTAS